MLKNCKNGHEYTENTRYVNPKGHVECKLCRKNRHKVWRDANPEKVRESQIRHRYAIEPDEYAKLLKSQNGLCAICKTEFTSTPHVDHDHITNAVRGLLCIACNGNVGIYEKFQRNPALLYLVEQYLKETNRDSS